MFPIVSSSDAQEALLSAQSLRSVHNTRHGITFLLYKDVALLSSDEGVDWEQAFRVWSIDVRRVLNKQGFTATSLKTDIHSTLSSTSSSSNTRVGVAYDAVLVLMPGELVVIEQSKTGGGGGGGSSSATAVTHVDDLFYSTLLTSGCDKQQRLFSSSPYSSSTSINCEEEGKKSQMFRINRISSSSTAPLTSVALASVKQIKARKASLSSKMQLLHIPKTGGTSIEQFLKKMDEVPILDACKKDVKALEESKKAASTANGYAAASCESDYSVCWHYPLDLLEQCLPATLDHYNERTVVCVVRDPIERFISEYYWRKRVRFKGGSTFDLIKGNITSFAQYTHKLLVGKKRADLGSSEFRVNEDVLHLLPQSWFVYDRYGSKRCHWPLLFSNLTQEWSRVAEDFFPEELLSTSSSSSSSVRLQVANQSIKKAPPTTTASTATDATTAASVSELAKAMGKELRDYLTEVYKEDFALLRHLQQLEQQKKKSRMHMRLR